MLLNPPYGERIAAAGVAGAQRRGGREAFQPGALAQQRREAAPTALSAPAGDDGADFFLQLAAHWKKHYAGWTAWMLTPDLKLPGKMRLKESRRVPMWNGPIECRLFRFDLVAGRNRGAQE
jgi:putative N6-adenine-specific DNA methylase